MHQSNDLESDALSLPIGLHITVIRLRRSDVIATKTSTLERALFVFVHVTSTHGKNCLCSWKRWIYVRGTEFSLCQTMRERELSNSLLKAAAETNYEITYTNVLLASWFYFCSKWKKGNKTKEKLSKIKYKSPRLHSLHQIISFFFLLIIFASTKNSINLCFCCQFKRFHRLSN